MPNQDRAKKNKEDKSIEEKKFDLFHIIIIALTFFIPLFILPNILDNAFERPKTLLLVIGASLLIGFYIIRYLRGKQIFVPNSNTPRIIILLLLLNGLNIFYTQNYYYTCVAAAMHVSCLIVFYFTSLYIDPKKNLWILVVVALGGLLVALHAWLQFFNIFILFKGHPGMMLIGTIGNSNHLGAYLLFPLFTLAGLFFIFKGRARWLAFLLFLIVFSAFLVTRPRASWLAFAIAFPLFIWQILRIYGRSPRIIRHLAIVFLSLAILVPLLYFSSARVRNTFSLNSIFASDTFHLRFNKYWPQVWHLFIQNPLFGNGFWSYRNLVYEAQAQIHQRTGDFFKNYPEPKPREAHNDLIEVFNDGGMVLAFALLFFLIMVLRHGWRVIHNENLPVENRMITLTAFFSVIAIMLACFFFFPFRVNTTMFLAALMMGILEGSYLYSSDLILLKTTAKSGGNYFLILLVGIMLIGFSWFTAVRPILAERQFFKYRLNMVFRNYDSAMKYLRKALEYDPLNTTYNLDAAGLYFNYFKDYSKADEYLERAVHHFNGDIVGWSLPFMQGQIKLKLNDPLGAKAAFEKALYLNPGYEPAQVGFGMVNKILSENPGLSTEVPKPGK